MRAPSGVWALAASAVARRSVWGPAACATRDELIDLARGQGLACLGNGYRNEALARC